MTLERFVRLCHGVGRARESLAAFYKDTKKNMERHPRRYPDGGDADVEEWVCELGWWLDKQARTKKKVAS